MKILSALLTATVLAATPGVALADSPPPQPSLGPGDVADAPLKTSKHSISGTHGDWGLDWFELGFQATTRTAILQISQKPPTQNVQGVYSMGAAQPIALTGKGGGSGDITLPGQKYTFSQRSLGLAQGTIYHFLITLPVGSGFKPVQATGSIRTEHHGEHTIKRRLDGLDLTFTADRPSAFVSVSTSSEISGGKLQGGTAIAVKGTALGDGRFRFSHSFEGLKPGTAYFVYSGVGGSRGTDQITQTSTLTRQVEVTVSKITVADDADSGVRGKGELLFQVRGTNTPAKASLWGGHYGETGIGSGDTVNLSGSAKAPRHTVTTNQDTLTVQVEGRESDAVTKSARTRCEEYYNQPHQNHQARWLNAADSGSNCYQFSYAQTSFDLRQGAVQTRTFSVARSPELRFTVTVRVVVTAV